MHVINKYVESWKGKIEARDYLQLWRNEQKVIMECLGWVYFLFNVEKSFEKYSSTVCLLVD